MFGWLRQWLPHGRAAGEAPPGLPAIDRESIGHLWHRPDGLPRVDWDLANRWIDVRADARTDARAWRRAVMAACLDELRDSLAHDHRRWRSRNVEGLAPLDGSIAHTMAAVAERSYRVLRSDLRVIRGDSPIPPIALVAVEPEDSYIDFTNSYFPDEGAFATSGGLYLNEDEYAFPIIAIQGASRHGCEAAVAHELTHHALHGAGLPLWVEEGFTQMMEERVVRVANFAINAEMVARQRAHWSDNDVDGFLDGSAFHSPEDDTQELAYHLSQWVVRVELSRRSTEFFRFAKSCREAEPDHACQRILGVSPRELVMRTIGIDD